MKRCAFVAVIALAACPQHVEVPVDAGVVSNVDHYTCPMHTSVRADRPGQCPICHMDLVPVMKNADAVIVDAARRSAVGIATAPAVKAPMTTTIRALGHVAVDETKLRDVTVRVAGFVDDVAVDQVGMKVAAGQTLFTITSPEIVGALNELRRAEASGDAGLVAAAKRRIELWGLTPSAPESERVPITSPQAGVVVEKDLVAGSRVEAGQRVLRIARLDRVWIEAHVDAADVADVKAGTKARVHGKDGGVVARVLPSVDPSARTASIRIDVDNKDGALLPGMTVDVELQSAPVEVLQVPSSSIVYTGERRVVFVEDHSVDEGAGRLVPRTIEIGRRSGDVVEVTKGLAAGDVVVVAGTFLVAAEARLQSVGGAP